MRSRFEYTMCGLCLHLKGLLSGTGKFRPLLLEGSGIQPACLARSRCGIQAMDRPVDAFLVSISKVLKSDQSR
jgi:hypothetical protein